ncbi:AAA family ATPase [Holdemania massiliensis]|uniref:AAA family ATPase n=4 Tax=Holdemania massiliensis TaxID=1468449 RepID=A0A6N7S5M6_9FIRM|nr:AAA family ATPase [Holdemania massiliensis]MSA70473.1 AAA family ATPase [Holdemania massiliensis]MSA88930.1 AAA family ATPase [Holdemania massiliensis]MSB77551.1 AAA family ATPase [Holdemania massiliensis]MSC32477.1 AAA family ATPase [Holdemania massiliensis]MSC38797.1 AAA family ATPase [Holdemania massiliensis]
MLIDGARRVGKSYIAEEFAKAEYKSYILIDFNRIPKEITDLFELYLNDLDTFFLYLSNYYNVKLYERETLVIFDEVQLFPRARSAIKYLVADGRYDYLETGSLMSIKANTKDIVIPSEERHIKMFPLDFEEFLWALDNQLLMDFIRQCFQEHKPMGQALHRKAMDYFRQYLVVGGMPQAVQAYVQTKDFERVDRIKRDILKLYRADMIKHAQGYEMKVEQIFDEIPAQLQKHEKKFKYSSLKKEARFRDYEDAFFWLSDAMIVNICYNSTAPNIGLKLNRDRMTMKCYMADTGLLISHAFDENGIVSEEIYKKILFDKLEFNQGMIVENIVAQMLAASSHKLYFYSNSSKEASDRMEIDFLIAKSKISNRHNISPIEVKSSKKYTLSSLHKFCTRYSEQLHLPYVLHPSDLKEENGILYLPLYMTPLL